MKEALIGFIGVLVGSGITWFQAHWFQRQEKKKAAQYLATRVVCVLDKFLVDCIEVVKDKGLYTLDGGKVEKIPLPGLAFPTDIDWKSVEPDLMYRLLSFPTEVESFRGVLQKAWDINPKDRTIGMEERAFHYAQWGLHAHKLLDELCKEYGIKKKTYNDPNYNPVADLTKERDRLHLRLNRRFQQNTEF
ncbi:MAG TPA: hypothetical protein PLX33_08230 [Alphaproteobacteria bacterium]|nr:hypothetical protein [Alphaproteobacteria bacterium]